MIAQALAHGENRILCHELVSLDEEILERDELKRSTAETYHKRRVTRFLGKDMSSVYACTISKTMTHEYRKRNDRDRCSQSLWYFGTQGTSRKVDGIFIRTSRTDTS